MSPAEEPEGGTEPARFDESLAELEKLVEQLEQGDLSLEESLAQFERGVTLARQCREALTTAEQKVEVLMARDGEEELTPFTDADANSGAADDAESS